jgi:hypothetical protein
MTEGFWRWFIRTSDVTTNVIDLLSFILVTPEIIGRERISRAYERLSALEVAFAASVPIIRFVVISMWLFMLSLLVVCVLEVYWIHSIFAYIILLPILIACWLYAFWDVTVLMAFQDADNLFFVIILKFIYIIFEPLVFKIKSIVTPTGMLYTAMLLFLQSRVLSIIHALSG